MAKMKATEIQTAQQIVEAIRSLWAERSIRKLRGFLGELETEDDFYRLMRLTDQADLYTYSHLLATQAHKRFGTLRTFTWQCARLLETGRSLEAEERMMARLQGISSGNDSREELASAHQLLLRIFSQLNRLPEAKAQLDRYTEQKGFLWPDLEGYYFIHSGEWQEAERVLERELSDTVTERSQFVRLLYADVLAMTGRQKESLEILERGEELEPGNWTFRADIIRTSFFLGHYGKTLQMMAQYDEENPYHVHRRSFVHMAAECLYKLERWEDLKKWMAVHQKELEKTVYGKGEIQQDAKRRELKLTPNIQKLNYCVPASLALMLEAYGMKKGQDEIAEHVFDVTGSDLQKTMEYMESLGFTARYFKGTPEIYKGLIDAGIPVLLSMMIENNSHVQVVTGYDDRLQALIIQDPNELGPFLLSYQDIADTYKLTDSLSMVFLTEEQQGMLELLDSREHDFFNELFAIWGDESIGRDKNRGIEFLKRHPDECYAAVVGLVTLFSEEAKALHSTWLTKIQQELGKEDAEVALLAAHMHYQKDETDEALENLAYVTEKNSPYALFLKAAILMSRGEHTKAIPLLKRSIELDNYQPMAYSHLSRCYLETGKTYQAFKWSSIALEQVPNDVSTRVTHSLIQYESGAYEKALVRFRELSAEQPEDGYFIYESGRCLLALGEEAQAIAAFGKSRDIDPKEPFSYLRIAEIHLEAKAWPQAEEIIRAGIANCEKVDVLHLYLGHIAMGQEQYKNAETEYRTSLELDSADLFTVTHIAHALLKQQQTKEVRELIMQYADSGDTDYFVRTAAMLWQESLDDAGKALALDLLENGMKRESLDLHEMAEQYAEFGEAPQYIGRLLDFFKALRATGADPLLLCYEGSLYETENHQRYAEILYTQAVELNGLALAHYRLGLLAEPLGEWDEALAQYTKCAEAETDFTAAHEGLMRTHLALEDKPRAFTAALHVLENEPLLLDLGELFELVDNEVQLKAVEQALEKVSLQVPEEWLLAAQAHVQEKKGDVAEAESLFRQAKAVNGAYPSHYQHIEFCIRQGELKRAVGLLEKLIAEHPDEEGLYAEYIRLLVDMRKTGELHKRLKKQLKGEELAMAQTYSADQLAEWVDEEEEAPKHFIRRLRDKSRRFLMITNVISLYLDAMKNFKDNEVPILHLSEFYMGRAMAEDAVEELTPFVKRTGHFGAAKFLLQASLQEANDKQSEKLLKKAIKQAEDLHKQQPTDVDIVLWQGDMAAICEEIDKAAAYFEQAIALNPYRSESYVRLMHLLAEHHPEQAKHFGSRLPDELQVNEWIRLSLAMTCITMGDSITATTRLLALQDDAPNYLPVGYELARAAMLSGKSDQAKELLSQLFNKDGGEQFIEVALEEELFEEVLEEVLAVGV
ncbi:tetratricopeptide repeat protein [Planococcus sp. SE5232]|uniref:tetratricopeptide repeat protein n=1 Tax=unclassified Planococcus (in: firmicutes) TaxID=2662419 RepID=UPI003D6A6B60